MNKNKLVSVIIPLYNKEKWIKKCINSVLNQTYQNFEILIIDDGSTDNSLSIVKKINDARINIIEKKNGGVSSARNLGLKNCEGDIVAFLDADDFWYKQHIEMALEGFYINENIVLSANRFNELHRTHVAFNTFLNKKIVKNSINYYLIDKYLNLLVRNLFLISSSSVLINNLVIKKYNLAFENDLKIGEDVNFWLKLNNYGSFVISDYIGAFYQHNDDNSLMLKLKQDSYVQYVPDYFKNIDMTNYPKEDLKLIKKFLANEFYKKAFQNRGKKFKFEELKNKCNGCNFSFLVKIKYFIIRFMPYFLLNYLK